MCMEYRYGQEKFTKGLPLAKADFSNIYYSTFLPTVPFFPLLEEVSIVRLFLVLHFVQCHGNRGDVSLKAEVDH